MDQGPGVRGPGEHGASGGVARGGRPRARCAGRAGVVAVLAGLLTLAAGCGGAASAPSAPPAKTSPASSTPAASSSSGTSSAPAKLTPLTVAYVIPIANQVPLWIGVKEGLFKRYGLNVKLEYIAGSVTATAAMTAGSVQIIESSPATAVEAALKGADTVVLAIDLPYDNDHIMALSSIHTMAQLKGKTIAVTKPGTVSDIVLREVLPRYGLKPGVDVKFAYLNTPASQIAGLSRGEVQAISVTPPATVQAQQVGAHDLLNIETLHVPYPVDGIDSTRAYVKAHPKAVEHFLEGYVAAIKFVKAHPKTTEQVIGQYSHLRPGAALTAAYQDVAGLLTTDPVPHAAAIASALKVIKGGAGANPAKFVDPQPLAQAVAAMGKTAG
jgi:NitT/TauT family transport system substrate-binding protein